MYQETTHSVNSSIQIVASSNLMESGNDLKLFQKQLLKLIDQVFLELTISKTINTELIDQLPIEYMINSIESLLKEDESFPNQISEEKKDTLLFALLMKNKLKNKNLPTKISAFNIDYFCTKEDGLCRGRRIEIALMLGADPNGSNQSNNKSWLESFLLPLVNYRACKDINLDMKYPEFDHFFPIIETFFKYGADPSLVTDKSHMDSTLNDLLRTINPEIITTSSLKVIQKAQSSLTSSSAQFRSKFIHTKKQITCLRELFEKQIKAINAEPLPSSSIASELAEQDLLHPLDLKSPPLCPNIKVSEKTRFLARI